MNFPLALALAGIALLTPTASRSMPEAADRSVSTASVMASPARRGRWTPLAPLPTLARSPVQLSLTGLREPDANVQPETGSASPSREPVAPEAEDPEAEARRLAALAFASGEAAYKRGAFPEAIRAFARAQALAPHPHTLYNLGLAQTHDGRLLEAWHTFTELQRTAETDEQRSDANTQQDALRESLAFLRVDADPDDRVCLGEAHLLTGTTHALLPGTYAITAGAQAQRVELRAGETLQIDLRFGASSARSRAMMPWLGTTAGAAAAAFGFGIGAATYEPGPTARGLAGAAAGAAVIALVGVVGTLVVHRRGGPVPRTNTGPASPC